MLIKQKRKAYRHPSTKRLRQALAYNKRTGIFTWNCKVSDKVVVGNVAGTNHREGYCQIKLDGVFYLAHRLAWQYVHGKATKLAIDHIDGNRSNNRIRNLRPVHPTLNSHNRVAHGGKYLPGVTKNGKGFLARISISRKTTCLGTYATQEEAHAAYMKHKTKISPRMRSKHQTNKR